MRDMLAGFRIRDLDFRGGGRGLKLAKAVADHSGATIVSADENRKSAELEFPRRHRANRHVAAREIPARGGKRKFSPATISGRSARPRFHLQRDCPFAQIRTSRGLLLDPLNGLADLERRELRAVSAYGFYDDPRACCG